MWEQTQFELVRREKIGAQYSSSDVFASKLICEDCGGFYGKKKWHSNSKYSRFIYQCNNKFHKHKDKCQTPNLSEEDIKLKFLKAYNLSMEDKQRILQDSKDVIDLLTDATNLDNEIAYLDEELIVVPELVNKLVKENSKTSEGLENYNIKYEELSNRYEKLKIKRAKLLEQRNIQQRQALKLSSFVINLNSSDDKLDEWNERIWMLLIDSATIHRDEKITFKFKDDLEVRSE